MIPLFQHIFLCFKKSSDLGPVSVPVDKDFCNFHCQRVTITKDEMLWSEVIGLNFKNEETAFSCDNLGFV